MNPYIAKLNAHLTEHPPCYGYMEADTLLEMLYHFYSDCNPINTPKIQHEINHLFHCLALPVEKQFDDVLDIVCGLCTQHEKLAFLEGVRVGVRLAEELDI